MDKPLLDWTLLRAFLAVVDEGSLLRAARRLGTYQPTLSRQIAELESQLGAALFERTGRGLLPTAVGLSIVEHARSMAESADALQAQVKGASASLEGTVRIACSQVVACHLMPAVLTELRASGVAAQFEIASSNEVSNLLRREADIALRLVAPTQSSLIAKRIAQIPMGAFASKDYLAEHGTPRRLADLRKHALVGLDTDGTLIHALGDLGLALRREDFSCRSDDQVAVIELVRAGLGIGFMPLFVGRRDPNLRRLLPEAASGDLPVWAVVHREIRGNRLIRAVFDALATMVPRLLAES